MNELSTRKSRPPRRQREKRAYQLAVTSGGAAIAAVVLFVLAVVGVTSLSPAILAAVISAGAAWGFRRTVT